MALLSKNIVFFFFQSVIGKTLNISTSTKKRTSMVIQTKQVFKYILHWNIIIVFFTFQWIRAMCLHQVEKICYRSLNFMKFCLHILNIYGKIICWNGILTKTLTCKNFNSKFDWIQNIQLKIGVPSHKKWMPIRYHNTYKAIYSINELINDIVI